MFSSNRWANVSFSCLHNESMRFKISGSSGEYCSYFVDLLVIFLGVPKYFIGDLGAKLLILEDEGLHLNPGLLMVDHLDDVSRQLVDDLLRLSWLLLHVIYIYFIFYIDSIISFH